VQLSNPSFVEKKRKGNALGLLTGSTHERRFLEAQIHLHNYFSHFKGPSRPICRYDIYLGHRPKSRNAQGQKSLAGGYPFHASTLRNTDPTSRHGNDSGHIDPNMLHAPRSGSFLVGNPAKLTTSDAPVTFYTNHMLTQK
jgi:hypothetical protein